jgi:2-oxoisovalerate dehydrogenase E1 component alpha subunit
VSESRPLRLEIPSPPGRPGAASDFARVRLSGPGVAPRPEIDADPDSIRDLAFDLIRVLDDDGAPVGPWDPELHPDDLLGGLRDMLTVRSYDRRMLTAQRQGKTSFYMTALGEEAVSCGHQAELQPGDMNFPTYRQQGLLITAGYPLESMMNQIYSNAADPLHGRQLPVMYSSRSHGFFSISGNLATQFIQGVGWAMASAIKGSSSIASAWIGDGSTAESDFHSGMLFASTYQPPVLLNIVNNQWAISTSQDVARGHSSTFAARGIGFGIPALRVDGNDFLAVRAATRWAATRARSGHGPTVIEWVTYRAGAHSTSDDPDGYRPEGEAAAWPLGDPVERLERHIVAAGTATRAELDDLAAEVETVVGEAQTAALSHGTLHTHPASAKDMFDDVYAEIPPHLLEQREEAGW